MLSTEIITSPTAAQIAGLHRVHFARLIRDGKGPLHHRVRAGSREIVLILRKDLDAWMAITRRMPVLRGVGFGDVRVEVSRSTRSAVSQRDFFRCVYCGAKQGSLVFPGARKVRIHIDHIVPVSRGGSSSDISNLCCACETCNQRKGCRTPYEAGMEVRFLSEGLWFDGNKIVLATTLDTSQNCSLVTRFAGFEG